jgi:hypothetical protein
VSISIIWLRTGIRYILKNISLPLAASSPGFKRP